MADKPLKAYSAFDGDEQWTILFATNGATARRHAAGEFGCSFGEVQTCTRKPSLDEYAGGPIPIRAILDLGWWAECAGCGRKISNDDDGDWDYQADKPRPPTPAPVGTWTRSWCCQACRDEDERQKAVRGAAQSAAIVDVSARVLKRFAEAEVTRTYAYADWHDGAARLREVCIDFMFPGATVVGASARLKPGESPDLVWTVCHGDQEAFEAYIERTRAPVAA